MRFLFFILFFTSLRISFSQCETLHFAELGSEPAICRTTSYQSGNGFVYAAAAGGTPDYTYEWTNLTNGQATSNSILTVVNPGEYQIKVTDDLGCVITAIVKVDSINPIANFELESITIDTTLSEYSAEIILINTSNDSINNNSPNPFDEPYYFWKGGNETDWSEKHFLETYSTTINTPGFHEICLIAVNKNFCKDTLCQSITVSPPVFEADSVNVYYSSVTGEVSVEVLLSEAVIINLVEINGGVTSQYLLQPGINTFQLDSGIYAYEIINAQSSELICSGTIAVF